MKYLTPESSTRIPFNCRSMRSLLITLASFVASEGGLDPQGRWMNVGRSEQRDRKVEEKFLVKYYWEMPCIMLSYAIEELPERERLAYLHGTK